MNSYDHRNKELFFRLSMLGITIFIIAVTVLAIIGIFVTPAKAEHSIEFAPVAADSDFYTPQSVPNSSLVYY